jgi:hypothetical protein
MERHVTLLGILQGLWGALAGLVGVSMLLLAAGALVELLDPSRSSAPVLAGLTATMLALVGGFALSWGIALVWTAILLERRRPWARTWALALAVVNLFVLPFGTALGIYAFWVLLNDAGRRLFEPAR